MVGVWVVEMAEAKVYHMIFVLQENSMEALRAWMVTLEA